MKPLQILRLEIHLGFKLTETKNLKDIFDWPKRSIYLLNDTQEVIGLNLSGDQIQNLKNLIQLQQLHLSRNQIQDYSFLKDLTQLQSLDVSQDYSFLKDLTQLQELDVSRYYSFLKDLTQLQELNLGYFERFNTITTTSFIR